MNKDTDTRMAEKRRRWWFLQFSDDVEAGRWQRRRASSFFSCLQREAKLFCLGGARSTRTRVRVELFPWPSKIHHPPPTVLCCAVHSCKAALPPSDYTLQAPSGWTPERSIHHACQPTMKKWKGSIRSTEESYCKSTSLSRFYYLLKAYRAGAAVRPPVFP